MIWLKIANKHRYQGGGALAAVLARLALAILFCGALACVWPQAAAAQAEFDGKWFFEEELLEGYLPPEAKMPQNSEEARKWREQFMSNSYMSIDISERKIEVSIFGEETETDYFEVLERDVGRLKIRPLSGGEPVLLRIDEAGRLEFGAESGHPIYLIRSH